MLCMLLMFLCGVIMMNTEFNVYTHFAFYLKSFFSFQFYILLCLYCDMYVVCAWMDECTNNAHVC